MGNSHRHGRSDRGGESELIRSVDVERYINPSSGRQRPFREGLWESGAPYLTALFVTPVMAQFTQYLFPGRSVLGAQSFSTVLALLGSLISLALWFLYRPRQPWPLLFQVFMGGLLALWVFAVVMANVHGDAFNLTALLVPLFLLMVWLKRPQSRDVWRAGDALAWSLVAVAVTAQLLDWMGLRELRYDFWNRLPFIDQVIGPIGRWEGPFGSSNLAGPIGAFLVAYGLFRYGLSRWAMVFTGGVIVFVSDSRTGYLGVLVALFIAILFRPSIGRYRMTRARRVVLLAVAVGAFVALVVALDPTVNGRTTVWSLFWNLFSSSPFVGVGGEGITSSIQGNGLLDGWATHGHNILIDPLARFGLFGVAALLVAVSSALVLTFRAARVGQQPGLVLLACFLAVGVTEDVVDWRYLGIQALPLLLAAMLGVGAVPQGKGSPL